MAVLWGANIGSMYPIVEIIFGDKSGQTLQVWIDKRIAEKQARWPKSKSDIAISKNNSCRAA